MQRFIYLHGFASGAQSRKARFFGERMRETGRLLETPDLAGGDFENLTVGGQLQVLTKLLGGERATLIGSSLGGYLAALYAARHEEVERLVLLAPAFGFAQRWREMVGIEALERWRTTGSLAIYHYSEQRMRNLGYGIVEESERWEPEPTFQQPAIIFHGLLDTVVPPAISREYVRANPHVGLRLVDSDHELGSALEQIWAESGLAEGHGIE